ncbi:MAG: glycogen/starch/alpha-glucan phosphorylase [Hyphomicrobiaceae bacterium]|nr:glycogen/starch/alpha-glucan phosphorylase [Hyphomicrobiaceae bacterium]
MLQKPLPALLDPQTQSDYLIELDDVPSVKRAIIYYLVHAVGKDPAYATPNDWFFALAFMIRGVLSERYINTTRQRYGQNVKRVYYLSMEYLVGRSLTKNLIDLHLLEHTRAALAEVGQTYETIADLEHDPGLGNGGLGRLAACFLESMATLGLPGCGYGLRYEFGLFSQGIENGAQVEHPDNWLKEGNPWEFRRPDIVYEVHFGGTCSCTVQDDGRRVCVWTPAQSVHATSYDFPIAGYRNGTVTNLRLWTARATGDFDLAYFNRGNYIKSTEEKITSEVLSKILYPDDSTHEGRELRLKQEYFFVSASIQDILTRFFRTNTDLDTLPDKAVIQLNDTHPALGIAELMRLLVDVHGLDFDHAFDITSRTFAYTNHTLLPEALERWPIGMLRALLPRHLEIIFDLNVRLLERVRAYAPNNPGKTYAMSLVEDADQSVRMAHLAILGSTRVNGVAKLHSDLLRANMFPDFDRMYPGKFINITNGVTPRRWLKQSNPGLSELITERIGEGWPTNLSLLRELAPLADDAEFRERFRAVKAANKVRLANFIEQQLGIPVPCDALFDTQIKRIHEYKRQLLNVLHVITRYNRIRDGAVPRTPRVVVLSGKAAPGYFMAKLIIRLIHDVARVINSDPAVGDMLKVVFVPDYSGTLAEIIIPGTDLSEQISTAGTEASGTSNMKFAMNGALTIGTWDGANIEIAKSVGEENIFIFGLRANEVTSTKARGYDPRGYYRSNPQLHRALDMIGTGYFSPSEPGRYAAIFHSLFDGGDHYMLLADYESYMAAHEQVSQLYLDPDEWARKAVLNVSGMGYFSSDRAVQEYADNIWGVAPLKSPAGNS